MARIEDAAAIGRSEPIEESRYVIYDAAFREGLKLRFMIRSLPRQQRSPPQNECQT